MYVYLTVHCSQVLKSVELILCLAIVLTYSEQEGISNTMTPMGRTVEVENTGRQMGVKW